MYWSYNIPVATPYWQIMEVMWEQEVVSGVEGSCMCAVCSLGVLVIVASVVSIGVHVFSLFSPIVGKSTEIILRSMQACLERKSLSVEVLK